jgi:hypothetical protein
MTIYILLSHEWIVSEEGEHILIYEYSKCFNKINFKSFIKENKLTYSESQQTLCDLAGFERYNVIIETV